MTIPHRNSVRIVKKSHNVDLKLVFVTLNYPGETMKGCDHRKQDLQSPQLSFTKMGHIFLDY